MILNILNEWDSLDVLKIVPENEYETITQTIEKMIK